MKDSEDPQKHSDKARNYRGLELWYQCSFSGIGSTKIEPEKTELRSAMRMEYQKM